jgi:DNA-binding SARP family transcriptional activator
MMRAAVECYRGDLLDSWYVDWCLVERERLQALYVRVLARLLANHSENGEIDLAIDCARRILSCDALREEIHRDLIRLLLKAGQPAAALKQYRICEELLGQELAIQPAPETRALLAAILARGSAPEPADDDSPIERLSAMCETLRTQLAESNALLERVTAELQRLRKTQPAPPRLRKVVG